MILPFCKSPPGRKSNISRRRASTCLFLPAHRSRPSAPPQAPPSSFAFPLRPSPHPPKPLSSAASGPPTMLRAFSLLVSMHFNEMTFILVAKQSPHFHWICSNQNWCKKIGICKTILGSPEPRRLSVADLILVLADFRISTNLYVGWHQRY